MKDYRKTMLHIIICSILYFAAMMTFVNLNYIDSSVIKIIYLPIFCILIVAVLFRQYIFGYIFSVSTELGLTVEYIIQLSQKNHPTMKGAFLNTCIICLGFIIGVIAQIIVTKVKKMK